jgi:hypothetical protein
VTDVSITASIAQGWTTGDILLISAITNRGILTFHHIVATMANPVQTMCHLLIVI